MKVQSHAMDSDSGTVRVILLFEPIIPSLSTLLTPFRLYYRLGITMLL